MIINKSTSYLATQSMEKEQRIKELKSKCWDITKEKEIDIESFYTSFIDGEYDYDFYERRYGTYGKYCLTEEEFNILKDGLDE